MTLGGVDGAVSAWGLHNCQVGSGTNAVGDEKEGETSRELGVERGGRGGEGLWRGAALSVVGETRE